MTLIGEPDPGLGFNGDADVINSVGNTDRVTCVGVIDGIGDAEAIRHVERFSACAEEAQRKNQKVYKLSVHGIGIPSY